MNPYVIAFLPAIWMVGYLVTGVYLWGKVPYPILLDEFLGVVLSAIFWFVVMPLRGFVSVYAYSKKVGF